MAIHRCDLTGERALTPLTAPTIAMVVYPGDDLANHASLLRPFIPAADALLLPAASPAAVPGPVPVSRTPAPVELADLLSGRWPAGLAVDRILWVRDGEAVLTGQSAALLRQMAELPAAQWLLPVHYPLPTSDPLLAGLSLLSLEPRLLPAGSATATRTSFAALPVVTYQPPARAERPFASGGAAWAALYRALAPAIGGQTSRSIDALQSLYQQARRIPAVAAVVLRNLIALHLAAGAGRKAKRLLHAAASTFPGQPEFPLLAGWERLQADRPEEALQALTPLLESPRAASPELITGGGCASYRLLTLRGQIALRLGDQQQAVQDWSTAFQAEPMFLPPLRLLASQRLHDRVLEQLDLASHQADGPPAAADLVAAAYQNSSPPPGTPTASVAPVPPEQSPRPGIRWEGPFFTQSSLARVNRELAGHLLASSPALSLIPTEPHSFRPAPGSRLDPLFQRLWQPLPTCAVTVRHSYPPDLSPAPGKLVLYLPWEFNTLPRPWAAGLARAAEVWTYSQHIRASVVSAGIPPERVQVIPCGYDPATFHPDLAPRAPLQRSCLFLYVGGTILRKGYDLVVEAFLRTFAPTEDVGLIIKEFGGGSFYRDHSGTPELRQIAQATAGDQRRILLLEDVLSDADLARLYRAATCLVAPYRAEGFGLPILEALACGTPAIATGYGPVLDFCPPEGVRLLRAQPVPCGRRLGELELLDEAHWAQIDLAELMAQMRWFADHPEAAQAMGLAAATHVRSRFTWAESAHKAESRLLHLLET